MSIHTIPEETEDEDEDSPFGESSSSFVDEPFSIRMPGCTIVVEPLIFMVYLGIMGSLPLLEQYLYARYAEDYPILKNHTQNQTISEACEEINSTQSAVYNATQLIQAETAAVMTILNVVNSVPSIITTLLIGGYSDKKYRKAALVLPSIGLCLRLGVVVCVVYFNLDVYVLFIVYFIDGCLGSFGTLMVGAYAYVADIIKPDSRAFRIVILDALCAFSAAAGSFGVGMLIHHYGFLVPSICIFVLALLCLIYSLLMPETHIPIPGTEFTCSSVFKATFEVYTQPGERRHKLGILLFVLLFSQLPLIGSQAANNLFLMNYPLCWGPALIGTFGALSICLINLGSLIGSGLFLRCMRELHILLIGDLCGTVAFGYLGFCTTTLMVYLVPVLGLFEFLPLPMGRAFGSRLVLPSEQGALFAGMAVIYNLSGILGSIAFNAIYAETLHFFIGTVFEVCAGCYLVSFILGSILLVRDNRRIGYKRLPTSERPDRAGKAE